MFEGVQLTIDDAIAAGRAGMQLSQDAAERRDPNFSARAQQAFIAHLQAAPLHQASGEDLVDAALAAGAVPDDSRAFGGVFLALSRRGVIRCLRSDLPRRRGHGTSGGKLWGLTQ